MRSAGGKPRRRTEVKLNFIDPTPFMFGTFFAVVAGIAIGSGIVAMCWTASSARIDHALGAAQRETERLREEAETRLLDAATAKVRES